MNFLKSVINSMLFWILYFDGKFVFIYIVMFSGCFKKGFLNEKLKYFKEMVIFPCFICILL